MQWIELEVNAIICEQLGEGACAGTPDVLWLLMILTTLMGGCAGGDSSDVTTLGGVLGCLMKVCMAVSVVSGVAWELKSTCGISVFFTKVNCSLSGVGATWVVASITVGVVGITWMLMLMVVAALVWASASSSKIAPWNSALAWATIGRQSPVPCLLWLLPYNLETSIQVQYLLYRCFLRASGHSCSRCFLSA